MNPVESYIENQNEPMREMMDILRYIILSANTDMKEKISYGIPFFYMQKNICYLNQTKYGLDLGIVKGIGINRNFPGLELKDRKQVKTIRFQKLDDIDFELIHQILDEAIKLDRI